MPNDSVAIVGGIGLLVAAVAAIATVCYERFQDWQRNREHRNRGRGFIPPPPPESPPRQRRPVCHVCQERLAGVEDPIYRIPNCEHIFHVRCLAQLQARRCPFPACGREFPPIPMSPVTSPPTSPPMTPATSPPMTPATSPPITPQGSPTRQRREVCSVCTQPIVGEARAHRLPVCRHVFHERCLVQRRARTCLFPGCGGPLLS